MIVRPNPVRAVVLNFGYRFKQVMPQPVIPYGSVVALDVSILLGVSWLNVFQANPLLFGPQCQLGADLLRAVIAADGLRFATPLDHLIQSTYYTLRW